MRAAHRDSRGKAEMPAMRQASIDRMASAAVARAPQALRRAGTAAEVRMNRWKQLADAKEWKREYLAELRAQIQIKETLLRSLRTSYAELNQLEGRELALRHRWESAEDVEQVMADKRAFRETFEDLFCAAEVNGKDFFEACAAVS
jgi:hypothetical protein